MGKGLYLHLKATVVSKLLQVYCQDTAVTTAVILQTSKNPNRTAFSHRLWNYSLHKKNLALSEVTFCHWFCRSISDKRTKLRDCKELGVGDGVLQNRRFSKKTPKTKTKPQPKPQRFPSSLCQLGLGFVIHQHLPDCAKTRMVICSQRKKYF